MRTTNAKQALETKTQEIASLLAQVEIKVCAMKQEFARRVRPHDVELDLRVEGLDQLFVLLWGFVGDLDTTAEQLRNALGIEQ